MQTQKANTVKTTTVKKPVVLKNTGTLLTYKCITNFINNSANGNLNNIIVAPLTNVKLGSANPVPFGFTGKADGTRTIIQNAILYGVPTNCNHSNPQALFGVPQINKTNNNSLMAILNFAKPFGHSAKSPICIRAMLNGGYSTSQNTYGTGYIQLIVK